MSLSIASLLAESALRQPEQDGRDLRRRARSRTAQLWDQAVRYAAVLRDRGIGPGDRVALLMPNLPEFPMAYYGVLALGAVGVPIHYPAQGRGDRVRPRRRRGLRCSSAPGRCSARVHPGAALAGVPLLSVRDGDPAVERLDLLAADAEPIEP